MKQSTAAAVVLCFFCAGCAPRAEEAELAFEIPYEKYELPNGLEVILHEDHSDPIVAVSVLVHVGSGREKPGKTGFAHFFEHMSFNDSENVPRAANRTMIEEWGGVRNGGTNSDGTIYYEVVPKDAFERLLWIDSDRLGYMIKTVTEAALENEKQVVKNEKRQRYDNQPYGHAYEVMLQNLYPEGHPYSWPVIGSLADLQSATLGDVLEFYEAFYGPNNATLVIAGDIDPAQTRELVDKWFGDIERGPEVPEMDPRPATLAETRSLWHEDKFAQLPELRITYPTVESYHEDAWALDALARILSDGKRAPLYRTLVEEEKLTPSVSAYHSTAELAGFLSITVRANEGVELDRVKATIDRAFDEFARDGFSEVDLNRVKAETEVAFFRSISSVLGKAFQLAQYNIYAGDPGFVAEDLARVEAVTSADVMRVFERYIAGRPFVMTSFVPEGSEQLAVSGAKRADIFEEPIVQGAEEATLPDAEASFEKSPASFDRSVMPELGPMPLLRLPEVWSAEVANGMRVVGIEQGELPLVEISVRFGGGQLLEQADKLGASTLLAELMMEGTRDRTAEELEDAIGELGARVTVRAGREAMVLRATTLARHYDAVMALVSEILLEPRWDAEELERLRRGLLTRLKAREGNPGAVASIAFTRRLYGEEHILGRPPSGTIETVSRLGLEDLQAYFERTVSPVGAAVHVAGDVSREQVLESLAVLEASWQGAEVAFPSSALPAPPSQRQLFFVDVPDAKQSVIVVGRLALRGADPDFNRLHFANDRLGGGSSGRLFQLLRIQKGYTYGAGSSIRRQLEVAPFLASTSVRSNVTLESLELLRQELSGYGTTFSGDDLEITKNLRVKRASRRFETLGNQLDMLEAMTAFDLPADFVMRDQQEMLGLDLAAVRQTIARYIDEGSMTYVVVGDAESQLGRIAESGFADPVLVDLEGVPR
jgi:zinc protease